MSAAAGVRVAGTGPARAAGVSALLQRKCACGASNASVEEKCEACQSRALQRKLAIGSSNDRLELEADRVADQVMAKPSHPDVSSALPHIQRFTGHSTREVDAAPASVGHVLAGSGLPLQAGLRQDMEQRFGHDFSRVRVHTGAAAEQSAGDVSAHAYTVGNEIVFGANKFAPENREGRRLLAHELTHVVQQSGFAHSPGDRSCGVRASPSITPASVGLARAPLKQGDTSGLGERQRQRAFWNPIDDFPPFTRLIRDVRLDEDAALLIQWAEERAAKFADSRTSDDQREGIAKGILRAFEMLKDFERRAPRDEDGALLYRADTGVAIPWTADRPNSLDMIPIFSPNEVARWRKLATPQPSPWAEPKRESTKAPPKRTNPSEPSEIPESRRHAVTLSIKKLPGMTFATDEGQQLIVKAAAYAAGTRYTGEQIEWAVSRVDRASLQRWWRPDPGKELTAWQQSIEKMAPGLEFKFTLGDGFLRWLFAIVPSAQSLRNDRMLEEFRQGVVDARGGMFMGYGMVAVGGAALTAGYLAAPLIQGGAMAIGEGAALAGAGSGLARTAFYTGKYVYQYVFLNAPKLFGDAMLWSGAVAGGLGAGQALWQIGTQGLGSVDAEQIVLGVLAPPVLGLGERMQWRGVASKPGGAPPIGSTGEPNVGDIVPARFGPGRALDRARNVLPNGYLVLDETSSAPPAGRALAAPSVSQLAMGDGVDVMVPVTGGPSMRLGSGGISARRVTGPGNDLTLPAPRASSGQSNTPSLGPPRRSLAARLLPRLVRRGLEGTMVALDQSPSQMRDIGYAQPAPHLPATPPPAASQGPRLTFPRNAINIGQGEFKLPGTPRPSAPASQPAPVQLTATRPTPILSSGIDLKSPPRTRVPGPWDNSGDVAKEFAKRFPEAAKFLGVGPELQKGRGAPRNIVAQGRLAENQVAAHITELENRLFERSSNRIYRFSWDDVMESRTAALFNQNNPDLVEEHRNRVMLWARRLQKNDDLGDATPAYDALLSHYHLDRR